MRALPLLLLAGCSWTIDDGASELPLVGTPPEISSLQHFNNGPVLSSAIVYGVDNASWLSLQEQTNKMRVVRLSPPDPSVPELDLTGDKFLVTYRTFFVWTKGTPPADASMPTPATLALISAGDTKPTATFDFPLGIGTLVPGGLDNVFAYSAPKTLATTYDLIREDGSFRRSVMLPAGIDSADLGGTFFSADAQYFFDRSACVSGCMTDPDDLDLGGVELSSLYAHSTTTESDIDLGLQPRRIFLYEPSASMRQFVTCGTDGLRVVPIIASAQNPARVLDPSPCVSESFSLLAVKEDAGYKTVLFYTIGDELRRVPIDGSAAPVKALGVQADRVLAIYDEQNIIYSQTPDTEFIYGVGDGWLGTWRFMNRGRVAELSRDKKKMRWLENAAQSGGIGDLMSAPLDGSATQLAKNVYQYNELGDGRVLADANHAFRGTQNRIIAIDEVHGVAQWVVDQASQYSFIPNTTDLLVQIVTGPQSSDLVRVPLPAAIPLDAGVDAN